MFLKILKIRFELMQLLNQHFIYNIQKVQVQIHYIFVSEQVAATKMKSSFDISKQDA